MQANTKIFIFISALFFFNACSLFNSSRDEKSFKSASYAKPEYGFSLQYPQSWELIDRVNSDLGKFILTVFKKDTVLKRKLPLGIHTDMKLSYVAIWPHGLGTELPRSQSVSLQDTSLFLDLNFTVDRKESRVLLLKDGSIWAYFLKPKQPPESWSNFGFIYAQIGSTQSSVFCYEEETGRKLPMKDCHYPGKAQIVRSGNVMEKEAKAIRYVLESIRFDKVKEKPVICTSFDFEVTLKDKVVESPLIIEGKAKGSWFFEGIFTVRLYDNFGNLLAIDQAEAKSNWMANEPVPFESILKFEEPDSEGGRLVFQKANPSGLKKNRKSCSIPINFSR